MTGIIIADELPKALPIYYLSPIEFTAMMLAMDHREQLKAAEEGRKRKAMLSPHCHVVAYGADVRVSRRQDHGMRPPPEWLKEANISEENIASTLSLVLED